MLVVVVGGWRYHQVNAHIPQHPVEERFFQQQRWVEGRTVRFKIQQVKQRIRADVVAVTIHLFIEQKQPAHYGLKAGNFNLVENAWLNVPYMISNPASSMRHPSGKVFTDREKAAKGIKDAWLTFTVPKISYEQRLQPVRFSFLVPEQPQQFIKYSLYLPQSP
ncbi:hypothetical protein [Levilactobacillus senmaizukei]|uniref:hypothetical protein n=1 Tax=Levilactobacillus senmaizukei TaxID=431273 RepID=UPI00077BC8F7|nr:hypothetical protein [Levilactobacillus senmaizukei]